MKRTPRLVFQMHLMIALVLVASPPGMCLAENDGDSLPPGAEPSGARVSIEDSIVDLGTSLASQPVSHTFLVKNTGTEVLTLRVESTSCRCAAKFLTRDSIGPGDVGKFEVSFRHKKGRDPVGNRALSVVLATNDPTRPTLRLGLKVLMVEVVDISPRTLDFGQVEPRALVRKEFTINCYRDKTTPKIVSVESSSPFLLVHRDPEETSETGHSYRCEAVFDTSGLTGEFISSLLITTDSEQVPALELPVRASLPLALKATPARILFGLIEPGEHPTKSVVLDPREEGAEPVRILSQDQRLKAVIEPLPDLRRWRVSVTFVSKQAGIKAINVRTSVVALDKNGIKVAEVPVHAVVIPAKH